MNETYTKYNLGEKIMSPTEMKELDIGSQLGIIDEEGIFYPLFGAKYAETQFHEGVADYLVKKLHNPNMSKYIKYRTTDLYVAEALKSGLSFTIRSVPTCVAQNFKHDDKPVVLTEKMFIALYNLYQLYTCNSPTRLIVEKVQGLGWSSNGLMDNKEVMAQNQKCMSWALDRYFDRTEFNEAIKEIMIDTGTYL